MRAAVEINKLVRIAVLVTVGMVLSACTTAIAGQPVGAGDVVTHSDTGETGTVDPTFINNTDSSQIDRLAATIVSDVRNYWKDTYPQLFGKPWEELRGGYYSVDTADPAAPTPPCTDSPTEVEGNAFYCPTADIIAWDRAALLPVLRDRFGEASVMLVLAHEMGHAVQRRSGVTATAERDNSGPYPTIVMEAMADCYAGSFVRWIVDGKGEYLRVQQSGLDPALMALVTFRDPIGTSQSDRGAHGDAFDRVSAFQDGFDRGAKPCSQMTAQNRQFTQRGFVNAADEERGGNLPFNDMIGEVGPDLNTYFGGVVGQLGKQWRQPQLRQVGSGEPRCSDGDQGPVTFCQQGTAINLAVAGKLTALHTEIGDYATGTLLASRYGMAALAAAGKPLSGPDTQRAVLCLAGAYTGMLIARTNGFGLSPGDLDEAVQVLLRYDYAGRDAAGQAIASGFERVSVFRTGTLRGAGECGLR